MSPISPAAATPPSGTQVHPRCEAQVSLLEETGTCKLPGRLRLRPALWSQEDVQLWLRWAEEEYGLRRPAERGFQMSGRALCILTKDDFRRRAPGSGDVLYELLQCIKAQRRAAGCGPYLRGDRAHPGPEWTRPAQGAPRKSLQSQPPGLGFASSFCHLDAPSLARCPLSREGSLHLARCSELGCRTEGIFSFPRTPQAPIDGRIAGCRLLWDYLQQLLLDPRYEPYIRWEDKDAKVFRVVDPNGLARLWGNHKNQANMTYEKLSRALRHYYKLHIIRKEPGRKLLFRFLKTPGKMAQDKSSTGWRQRTRGRKSVCEGPGGLQAPGTRQSLIHQGRPPPPSLQAQDSQPDLMLEDHSCPGTRRAENQEPSCPGPWAGWAILWVGQLGAQWGAMNGLFPLPCPWSPPSSGEVAGSTWAPAPPL